VKGRFIGSVYGCREAAIAMVWTNALEVERGRGERGRGKKEKRNFVGPEVRHEGATLFWKG
jgi:hypothetical protein